MANPEQLEYLQDSADEWNSYRKEHQTFLGLDLCHFSRFFPCFSSRSMYTLFLELHR